MSRKEMNGFEKEFLKIEKNIEKDFKKVDGWIIQRRKFLIKLGIVASVIALLLIFSHYYLRVSGVGF